MDLLQHHIDRTMRQLKLDPFACNLVYKVLPLRELLAKTAAADAYTIGKGAALVTAITAMVKATATPTALQWLNAAFVLEAAEGSIELKGFKTNCIDSAANYFQIERPVFVCLTNKLSIFNQFDPVFVIQDGYVEIVQIVNNGDIADNDNYK